MRSFIYSIYERNLLRKMSDAKRPRHVGVILDGNRRWAKTFGEPAAMGHQKGAEKITEFLGWSEELGIEVVTLWMLSTDNLSREEKELLELCAIIKTAVADLAATGRWRIRVVGSLSLLPTGMAEAITAAADSTESSSGLVVNVAIGYGGRNEIADAVKSHLLKQATSGVSLADVASSLTADDISEHLYTSGQPDPDLLIRTSGEQRLGGFLLWQSAHSEFYFCEAYWPDFRKVDYLRALRDYSERERRLGK